MNRPLSIPQVIAILMLLFGLWIGVGTLAFTAPQFAALQRQGILKTARVSQKLPYRSICTGRNCKPYVLRVRFFSGVDGTQTWDLGETQITVPKVNPGRLVFAELEVGEAEYKATQVDDPKKIVFLESHPQQVWLAEKALAWKPWMNYAVSVVLLGAGLLLWNRRVSKYFATRTAQRRRQR